MVNKSSMKVRPTRLSALLSASSSHVQWLTVVSIWKIIAFIVPNSSGRNCEPERMEDIVGLGGTRKEMRCFEVPLSTGTPSGCATQVNEKRRRRCSRNPNVYDRHFTATESASIIFSVKDHPQVVTLTSRQKHTPNLWTRTEEIECSIHHGEWSGV